MKEGKVESILLFKLRMDPEELVAFVLTDCRRAPESQVAQSITSRFIFVFRSLSFLAQVLKSQLSYLEERDRETDYSLTTNPTKPHEQAVAVVVVL
jgi:hypothetical protein